MKNKKIIITALFACVLLNAAFLSLAAAEDQAPDATSSELTTMPERGTADPSDNSTQPQGEDILYTIQDNSTATETGPEIARPNLIAAPANTSNDVLPIVAAGIAIAFVVVAVGVGVVFYRKKQQTQNN